MPNRIMVEIDRSLRRVFPKVSVELTHSVWADTIRIYVGFHAQHNVYCGEYSIPPAYFEMNGSDALAAQIVYEILKGIAGCKPSQL